MFKWHHQYSVEVDAPINQVLNFVRDFNNWLKWIDQFESMQVEKVEGNTSTIKAKIKNRNAYAHLFFTEIVPQKKFQMLYKAFCFTQVSIMHYEKISPLKTKITIDTNISGFLTPLFRSYFKRRVEAQYRVMVKELLVYASNNDSGNLTR